jgi:hypothetical protein
MFHQASLKLGLVSDTHTRRHTIHTHRKSTICSPAPCPSIHVYHILIVCVCVCASAWQDHAVLQTMEGGGGEGAKGSSSRAGAPPSKKEIESWLKHGAYDVFE